ncbi:MAG: phosphopentomutase, partial [Pseudomonadota bacterium]
MTRAFLIVMDSVGCGGAPDAADFGDAGANTLGHIHRETRVSLPTLNALGLGAAIRHATGYDTNWPKASHPAWAVATEVSKGKDTPSGHWELAGVPVPWDWHYFPQIIPAFPPDVMAQLQRLCGGSLCNGHASGVAAMNTY